MRLGKNKTQVTVDASQNISDAHEAVALDAHMTDEVLRIKIQRKTDIPGWIVSRNFNTSANDKGASSIAKDLLGLSREWTKYCIATQVHSSNMSFIGSAVASNLIEDDLMSYLKDISVSHELCPEESTDGETYSFIIRNDDAAAALKRMEEPIDIYRATQSVARAQLTSIIAEFEYFCIRMVKIFANNDPKKFLHQDTQVPLGRLISGESVEEIISTEVEKRIRNEMRGSHSAIIEWLVEQLELGSTDKIMENKYYRDFMECCQRRHLFVHNGGIVNKQYLENCVAAGFRSDNLPDIDSEASISPSYLQRASGRCFLNGLYILHMAVQKIGKKEQQESLSELLSASHEFLLNKQTKMCTRVIDFAEFNQKHMDSDVKLYFGVNRALAQLFDPNKSPEEQNKSARLALSKYDWSLTPPRLNLALACVKRDFSDIHALAKKAFEDGIDFHSASTFAVFSEAREVEGFMECFPKSPLMISSDVT